MPLNLNIIREAVVEEMLTRGCAYLRVDCTSQDVDVPEHMREGEVVLRFGFGLTPPISDLAIDSTGISGTLTFVGMPYRCVVPWHAVRAAVDEESTGLVFVDNAAVRSALAARGREVRAALRELDQPVATPLQHRSERTYLRLVRDDEVPA
jgi:stringent starvation protein B